MKGHVNIVFALLYFFKLRNIGVHHIFHHNSWECEFIKLILTFVQSKFIMISKRIPY